MSFESLSDLIRSLKQRPEPGPLCALAHADDYQALTTLAQRSDVAARAQHPDQIRLLWEICQIPDYRQLLLDHHANLLGELFLELSEKNQLGDAWLGPRIQHLSRTDGDIETLMHRIAFVRTWTYVANHDRWLADPKQWQERTRNLEDELSDALHRALVARFIDVRKHTSHGRGVAPADEAHPFSGLQKLRQGLASPAPPTESEFSHALAEAPHSAFEVSARGRISFGGREVAQFVRGRVLVEPEISLGELALAPGALGQVRRRLQAFAKDFVSETLGDLAREPSEASSTLRGLCYQLKHSLGTLERPSVEALLSVLDDADKRQLHELSVFVGRRAVFSPQLLDADTLHRRHVLTRTFYGPSAPELVPRHSVVTTRAGAPKEAYLALGFVVTGSFALRVDLLEELLELPPSQATTHAIVRRCRMPPDEAALLARELGFGAGRRTRRRRRKRRDPSQRLEPPK